MSHPISNLILHPTDLIFILLDFKHWIKAFLMCENCGKISAELAALSVENHRMADLTVIDPDGDVIITVGKTGFQVSSKVLGLASPVFKALFGPSFAEGQFVIDNARLIELHDDDPEALDIMCCLLHHEPAPPSPFGIERLEKMAIIVDKYDCVRAMHYWAKLEIMAVRRSTKEPCRLLWPAYVFEEAQFFNNLTKFLVLHLPYVHFGEFLP